MHSDLTNIPDRILETALGALRQANTQTVFSDPGMEHRDYLCITSAALAGELTLKAVIATEHPLLIFRDIFHLEKHIKEEYDFSEILLNARTYQFEHLPKLLWVATGNRISDESLFERVRKARNAVQHFSAPNHNQFRSLSLSFIYGIIDPLINEYFGLCAISFHEDYSVGYDYVVGCLLTHEIEFSIPDDFHLTEINAEEIISNTSSSYRDGFGSKILSILRT